MVVHQREAVDVDPGPEEPYQHQDDNEGDEPFHQEETDEKDEREREHAIEDGLLTTQPASENSRRNAESQERKIGN